MKSLSRLPPPPQQINEYLNGHIIGHYVMKKALSVAIYNHYSSILISRSCGSSRKTSQIRENPEEILLEDTKSVFNRIDGTSLGRLIAGLGTTPKPQQTLGYLKEFYDSPEAYEPQEYMTPMVSRVIIEASSHRVHLRKTNTLTFDSTGNSKPLGAIASTIAQYLEVPYVRCDCSYLNPVQQVEFNKREHKDGTLAQLLSGYCGETINSIISRLYRKADFDLDKASRGIVFLDGMHKIGENQGLSKAEQQQVLREILQIVEGFNPVDVTRAGSSSMDREILDTSNMFFVCFGVFEAEEQLLDFDDCEDFEVIPEEDEDEEDDEEEFQILPEPNNNNLKDFTDERRDSRTSNISMDTTLSSETSSSERDSSSSTEKSPKMNSKKNPCLNSKNPVLQKPTKLPDIRSRRPNNTNKNNNNNNRTVLSNESDLSSASTESEWDEWEDDDSFQGLKENKLARMVTEAENSPIPHYQSLWGMKDVDLKFTPEALEVIANQALLQQAGRHGVATILEKLFLTIKFDILGTDIISVEITEDFVMGKSSPIYRHARKRSHNIRHQKTQHHLYSITEEVCSSLSDYDQGILEQLEI